MIRSMRNFLNRRVDPAPNPLRITVSDVDDQLAALRADPRWGHDRAIRLRADRLLDVRAVLAHHEAQDRRDETRPASPRPAMPSETGRAATLRGLTFRASRPRRSATARHCTLT